MKAWGVARVNAPVLLLGNRHKPKKKHLDKVVRETGSGKSRVGQKITKSVPGPLVPQLSNSHYMRKPRGSQGSPPPTRALFWASRHRNRVRFTRQRTPSQVEFFKQLEEKINQGADLED